MRNLTNTIATVEAIVFLVMFLSTCQRYWPLEALALNYNVLEKTSNEAFRVLWVEVSFVNHKNIVCGIIYGQHNSPDYFLTYPDKTIEILVSDDKNVYILVDFNIDLLKCESSQMSQDFLLSLRSCYLITTEDKLTRVIELLPS